MKFYHKIVLCLGLAATMTGMTGCSIDPDITDFYTEDVVWASPENMEIAIRDFYQIIGGYASGLGDDGFTDMFKYNNITIAQNMLMYGQTSITPVENPFDNWKNRYTWIQGINRFLANLETKGAKFPEAIRLKAEAEMRCFRGILYFDLAKRYGASVILFPKLPELGNNNHARCTPDQCWDFITADFEFAAKYLPNPSGAEAGRLTKGAAYGMQARAMLYAKRWQASVDACDALFRLNHYALVDDYKKLFNHKRTEGVNRESIIESGFVKDDFTYEFDKSFCPPGDAGLSHGTPTENLVSEYEVLVKDETGNVVSTKKFDWNDSEMMKKPYENRDPRFYATILYNGAQWKNRTIDSYVGGVDGYSASGGAATTTGYYTRKFTDETMTAFVGGWLTYYQMRYAEILLIYAEARAQLGSQADIDAALVKLNQVRSRKSVNLPAVTATSLSEFMDHLRHERMIELAFEGHRYWDLRRWGNGTTTLTAKVYGVKPIKNSDDTFTYTTIDVDAGKRRIYLSKYDRFPIPQGELDNNEAMEQFDEWK